MGVGPCDAVSAGGAAVQVTGLKDLVREMRGRRFSDVNFALREMATGIARELEPQVSDALRRSPAPQAKAMANTVRAKRDRIPVIVVGRVNPKFTTHKFGHKGESAAQRKLRRGSLAHGVVYGPLGGKRTTKADENYYAPQERDPSGGVLGQEMSGGALFEEACRVYLEAFEQIMTHYGFVKDSAGLRWRGGH